MDMLHIGLGAISGVLVGFTLGLVGGGGSILAVPLMVYLVGVKNPHIAIGTSAFAVAANAAIGLLHHGKAGNVKWRCGGLYAAAGIAGAILGSSAGKAFNGQKLLFLFALIMVLVGVLMLRAARMPAPQMRHAIGTISGKCWASASAPGCSPASSASVADF